MCQFCRSAFSGQRCGACGRARSERTDSTPIDERGLRALIDPLVADGCLCFRPRYPGDCPALLTDTTLRLLDDMSSDEPDRAESIIELWIELPYVDEVVVTDAELSARLARAGL